VNILIVKLSAIGDVIHTLPALDALRHLYPGADITWVVEEAAADLLTGHPALNRIIVSRRRTWIKALRHGRIAAPLKEMRAFWRELRQRPYDLVIDFHGLFKSAVIVLASGGKRKLGYDSLQEASGLFYNERIREAMEKHAVDRYLDFVRHLAGHEEDGDGRRTPQADPAFTVAVGAEECRRMSALLAAHADVLRVTAGNRREGTADVAEGQGAPFVAVNPVAFWETKLWEDGKFAELGDRIRRELGVAVVLTGGEAAPLERISAQMQTAAVNLGGRTTLRELACLYRRAALVVTTDSGPMHLAAAMGTPVVALFGPTDPARTGPYGPGHKVIRSGLACAPCFRKRCDTLRCMRGIGVEEVLAAVREVLETRAAGVRTGPVADMP
jgi:heptosyltransferase-1